MSVIVSELSKKYGDQIAVDHISFQVNKGDILGFLGPNGAGKSTTMKMITSYITPSEGNVDIDGISIYDNPIEVRKKVGYLPENNPLYNDMYVVEFLSFIAEIHGITSPRARIDEVIALTGLGKEQHKIIGTLSKGYRQRVGLAQAIIHDPDVLILDEPTSGLDANQLTEIRQLIRDLGKNKIVIFSTHIMQEVEALCNRVLIINNGKLVADAPIDDLKQLISGSQKVIVEFENAQIQQEIFSKIPGLINVQKNGNQFIFTHNTHSDIRKDIFQTSVKHNLTILEMRKDHESVEDIFRQLTKDN
jgi:ABC-2 type transport system ATP-binding protein